MRMYLKRQSQKSITPGTDRVIVAISLPSDCRLLDVWMNWHFVGPQTDIEDAVMYAITGYVLPVTDPDAGGTFDTIWDQQVPKDLDRGAGSGLDLDGASIDTTNEFEPGEFDAQELLNLGRQPEQIFRRRKMVSFATSPHAFRDGTPDTYRPLDDFKTHLRKNYRVANPSIVAFGVSSPMLTDTLATPLLPLAETEWPQIKYAQVMLHNALMDLMGLIEVGAETPFEDAAILLDNFIEPDVEEDDVGRWAQADWGVFCDAVFHISVPGDMGEITLSSGV